jgi:FlaA1/EpsC-like NDP-sugar epimerase
MTIPEACCLVLEAGTLGQGGEIFVLDMGEPVKIVDLAKKLIALSGLKVGEDIAIEFVGLRPGEKMFEELQHNGENMEPTGHHKIMKFIAPPSSFEQAEGMVEDLSRQLDIENSDLIREKLKQYIPEYSPCSASQHNSQ